MSVKIILVDDDEMSLFGLEKLIPWSECGYTLAGSFSCSDDAIEFVENNEVDVIVTDICMPKPDGLDLVAMMSDSHPDIKIIILSAYREFSYAQQALRFKNVVDYLTKPLEYNTFTTTLEKVKESLEIAPHSFSSRDDIYERLQFFSNLLCGNITETENMSIQLSNLGIDTNPDKTPCTLVVFHIHDFAAFQEKTSKYNSVQLYHAMSNLHPFRTSDGFFSLALCSYNNIAWLVIHKNPDMKGVNDKFASEIISNFRSIMGIDAVVSSSKTHASILELVNVPSIEDMEPRIDSDDKIIDAATNYIYDHLSENVSLDDVASHVFMSPAYFSAYFKKKTGEKFIDRLTSLRMERAAALLIGDDSLSANEVSNMIGYNHIGYFYRKFKSYFGITPTEYKNTHKK